MAEIIPPCLTPFFMVNMELSVLLPPPDIGKLLGVDEGEEAELGDGEALARVVAVEAFLNLNIIFVHG